MAKEKAMTGLTSVYEGHIRDAKSNPNLAVVRTELPAELAKDAKFPTGFIAVPKFDVHKPENSKFASVELHDPAKEMNIQYTDKSGAHQVAQVKAENLIEAHAENVKAYRKQKAAEMEASTEKAPSAEKDVTPEM